MDVELITLVPAVTGIATPLPLRGTVRRRLRCVSEDEYWLVELERPLCGTDALGVSAVVYLLLWPEPGRGIDSAMETTCNTGVDIVLDESLLTTDFLEFGKCHPIGVGRMIVRGAASLTNRPSSN